MQLKKSLLLAVVLAFYAASSLSEVLHFTEKGEYKMSQFDSIITAKAMAEQNALNKIAANMQEKFISIKKVDKNGFFSRAKWLVNGAVVNKTRISESVGMCTGGSDVCATVIVDATLDIQKSEDMIKKLYLNNEIAKKVEQLIHSDLEMEKSILRGEDVDIASMEVMFEKRKKVLNLLSEVNLDKPVTTINLDDLNDIKRISAEKQKQSKASKISDKHSKLDYLSLLESLRTNIRFEKRRVRHVVQENGSVSIIVTVKVVSDDLDELVKYVAKDLGIPNGDFGPFQDLDHPKMSFETSMLDIYSDPYVYWAAEIPLTNYLPTDDATTILKPRRLNRRSINNGGYNIPVARMHKKIDDQLLYYFIQQGVEGTNRTAYNPLVLDSQRRLNLFEKISKTVVVKFYLGDVTEDYGLERNIIKGFAKSPLITVGWDTNEPTIGILSNDHVFDVYFNITKLEDLDNLAFTYKVSIIDK